MGRIKSVKKLWIIAGVVVVIAVVLSVIGMLYHQYASTVEWKKTQQPELASLTPEQLYLSDDDRENIGIYNNYKSQLWDDEKQNFKSTDEELFENFVNSFTKIESLNLSGVNELFHDIKDIHDLRLRVEKVQAEKPDEYLKVIETVIKDEFDKLNTLAQNNRVAGAVQDVYKKLGTYATSHNQLVEIYEAFANIFTIGDEISVKDSVTTADATAFTNVASTFDRADLISRLQSIGKEASNTLADNASIVDIQQKIDETKELKSRFEALKKEISDKKKALDSQVVDYPSFVGKTKQELEKWAKENNINIRYRQSSGETSDKVKAQLPAITTYKRIMKGSTIEVELELKQVTPTTENATTTTSSTTRRNSR